MKRLNQKNSLDKFKNLLLKVQNEKDLNIRFDLIIKLMDLATELSYPVGIGTDNKNPGTCVTYIKLPTGQVSWHMPNNNNMWDGHSNDDKENRIREFISN